jgi:hypothetical protein
MLYWLSVMDFITILPLFFEIFTVAKHTGNYFVRLLLIVRTMRLLQLYRLLRLAKTAKMRQATLIVLTICCIIICSAVAIQVGRVLRYFNTLEYDDWCLCFSCVSPRQSNTATLTRLMMIPKSATASS